VRVIRSSLTARARAKYRSAQFIAPIAVAVLLLAATSHALEPGLPSKTAVYIAAARAIGSKHPDRTLRNPDYLAIKFLGPRERAILPDYPMDALDLDYAAAIRRIPNAGNVATQTFRTKAFDAALLDALHHGARQVVVLGAGFDSRGYRFQKQLRGTRFMEVDAAPTQEYKKRRVQEILGSIPANVTFVPMDFTTDSLLVQLTRAGYSERQNTFFLWEGVTVYLPESAVKDTLRFVRDHAAPGSRIAFDYLLQSNGDVNNPRSKWAQWGEPWIFGFPNSGAAAFVRGEGLDVLADSMSVQNICIATAPKRN
jgi:methyltransferase (TIGR00027 family)